MRLIGVDTMCIASDVALCYYKLTTAFCVMTENPLLYILYHIHTKSPHNLAVLLAFYVFIQILFFLYFKRQYVYIYKNKMMSVLETLCPVVAV